MEYVQLAILDSLKALMEHFVVPVLLIVMHVHQAQFVQVVMVDML
jgi:hypothetical protein